MLNQKNLDKINLGKQGEDLVAKFLEDNGFDIYEKNYKIRAGEIDIIAQKGEVLAFIEVKLRKNPKFCLSELIIPSKQRKIIKTALYYIYKNKVPEDRVYRFDVALLSDQDNQDNKNNQNTKNESSYKITYIKNAFQAK